MNCFAVSDYNQGFSDEGKQVCCFLTYPSGGSSVANSYKGAGEIIHRS